MKIKKGLYSSLLSCLVITSIFSIYACGTSRKDCEGEDGSDCLKIAGYQSLQDYKKRDELFFKSNPKQASKVRVYIECSLSMDGYITGHTQFTTTIHRLTGQLKADVLKDDKNLSFNFIDSETRNINIVNDQYDKALVPHEFSKSKGDRSNSDIISIIRSVVNSTEKGEVSMFVSDCVYSPESSEDLDNALQKQQTDMLNILKNKSKGDSSFGVLLYRLVSDFKGVYYTKTNAKISIPNGNRPYFVWFFGDQSLLASVYSSVSKIMKEGNAEYLVGIPGYKYLPYKTIDSDHAYHYIDAKTETDSIFRPKMVANLSFLPLDSQYIYNPANYTTNHGKRWSLGEVKEYLSKNSKNPSKKNNIDYNVEYIFKVFGDGDDVNVVPNTIEISLKSMLRTLPEWVEKYDDPKGSDYDAGYIPSKLRTFGLKSLVEGVREFYNESDYVTFKIIIN